jgi:hypothetical protein
MWVRPNTAAKYRLDSFLTCVNVCFAATMLLPGDVHFLLPFGFRESEPRRRGHRTLDRYMLEVRRSRLPLSLKQD